MGIEFLIGTHTPSESMSASDPKIDFDAFILSLRNLWPHVKFHDRPPAAGEPLHWGLPDEDGVSRTLGTLFETFATMDPATKDIIIEFALWFRAFTPDDIVLYLYPEGYMTFIELTPGMSAKDLSIKMSSNGYW